MHYEESNHAHYRSGDCDASQEDSSGKKHQRALLEFVEVPTAGTEAAMKAISYPMNDFDDALQAAAALAFGARFIITRNVSDYRRSPVPAVSPAAFIKEFGL
jgi:hypothetical protein